MFRNFWGPGPPLGPPECNNSYTGTDIETFFLHIQRSFIAFMAPRLQSALQAQAGSTTRHNILIVCVLLLHTPHFAKCKLLQKCSLFAIIAKNPLQSNSMNVHRGALLDQSLLSLSVQLYHNCNKEKSKMAKILHCHCQAVLILQIVDYYFSTCI